MLRSVARLGFAFLLAGTFVVVASAPASASILSVNTTADEYGTGASCSLREAIQSVNTVSAFGGCSAGAGGDTIMLPDGTYTLTRTGAGETANATGDLNLMADVTLSGGSTSGTEIVGMGDRVIEIQQGSPTFIRDLTVRGGNGVATGGGIGSENPVTVTLERVMIGPNTTTFAQGGGLAFFGDGGDPSIVTIRDSTIAGNTSQGDGGGIMAYDAHVTIERSLIYDNNSANFGDGIANFGEVTVRDSTIAGNGFGTIGDLGGGVFSQGTILTMENVTMVDNEGGASSGTGGHIYGNGGTITLRNVLMNESPISDECSNLLAGTYLAEGTNLVESPGFCNGFTASTNLALDELGKEGGPTDSVPIAAGSDARGDADDQFCGPTDQRGVPRPDGACDVGAYQFVRCFGVTVNRVGTPGSDTEVGDPFDQNESFLMMGGDDVVLANLGRDAICGGAGKDQVDGGSGKDKLDGGSAKDVCDGGGGRDKGRACEKEISIP